MRGKRSETSNPVRAALRGIISILVWISGILVALAVGFGMIEGTLTVPQIPQFIMAIGGWTVIVLTVFGAVLAIMHAFTRDK